MRVGHHRKPKSTSNPPAEAPEWLLENTTLDQIELMLDSLLKAQKSTRWMSTKLIFNEWERGFISSVNAQYNAHVGNPRPLTGKQLFWLTALFRRLAEDTSRALEGAR
jgi:hypothetical protein